MPSGTLNYSTTYYWHVRYRDNHGDWGDYSSENSFTTAASANDVHYLLIQCDKPTNKGEMPAFEYPVGMNTFIQFLLTAGITMPQAPGQVITWVYGE